MIGGSFSRMRKKGVLGMNERNLSYVMQYNSRSLFPQADDKVLTKKRATEAGIEVPELYATASSLFELRELLQCARAISDFVIKPAHGAGGEGVIVIESREEEVFRTINGELLDIEYLRRHSADVLFGLYSLGGQQDTVMLEYRVLFDPVFSSVTYQGVPDIRIIVFLGVPIMGMLRLPTRRSRGRANLHQGAVGVGIDITTGETGGGVWLDSPASHHPDTGALIDGIHVPAWKRILELSSLCFDFSRLGYLGVDVVLDRDRGPLVLEINARPGLAIQIANHEGLLGRLELVRSVQKENLCMKDRVEFALTNFTSRKIVR